MSLLGIDNINKLTECTRALPPFKGSYRAPDQSLLEKFIRGAIKGLKGLEAARQALDKGDKIPANAE